MSEITHSEDDLLPISALQHFEFCPRQWALIYLEESWLENKLTAEGRLMHKRAHLEQKEYHDGITIVRGAFLRSLKYGLIGKADVIEFTTDPLTAKPIEYKRGQPKRSLCDKVQLCAQALCLEEMLNISVRTGCLYYGRTKKRIDVEFDEMLRTKTTDLIERVRKFTANADIPPPEYSKKCDNCSLVDICQPKLFSRKSSVEQYLTSFI